MNLYASYAVEKNPLKMQNCKQITTVFKVITINLLLKRTL